MEEITRAVCADFECELVEFNGENNHVHLLVNSPPKVALSKLVNSLKGVSSRRLRLGAPPGRRLGESTPNRSGTTVGHNACVPARTAPDRWAGLHCRPSVSTPSSRIVHYDLRVRALPRIASPPG
jgi:hypothetical protein